MTPRRRIATVAAGSRKSAKRGASGACSQKRATMLPSSSAQPRQRPGASPAILDGHDGPQTELVLMHAAAAPFVAGKAADFPAGVVLAREAIASGRAREVLDHYVALTQEAASD